MYGDVFYPYPRSDGYELLIKTDDAGNISWANKYGSGNNDYGSTVAQTSDK
ncbi:MAG: hypothetical protein ABJA79_08415 [Parafilimonas sp.]